MKIAAVTVAVAVLVLVAVQAQAHAQTAAVLPPTGVNVDDGTLVAAQDVLQRHLAETRVYRSVVAVPGPTGRAEPARGAAVDQALAAGGDVAIVLHVTRLGSTLHARLVAYATADDRLLFAERMPAKDADDLDRVLERLVQSMVSGRPTVETAELHTVTAVEATAPLKRASTHTFGLSIGEVAPHKGDSIPGFGVYWLYDSRSFLADVAIAFHSSDSRGDFTVGIGAYYPFGSGDFAPYLGGGARWSASDYGEGHGTGIQLYAAVGAIAFRLGSVQIRAQLEAFINAYRTELLAESYNVETGGYDVTSTTGLGRGGAVSVGLGF